MKYLKTIFDSPDGDCSSKRILATLLIVAGITYAILGGCKVMACDNGVLITLISGGIGLLGINGIFKV